MGIKGAASASPPKLWGPQKRFQEFTRPLLLEEYQSCLTNDETVHLQDFPWWVRGLPLLCSRLRMVLLYLDPQNNCASGSFFLNAVAPSGRDSTSGGES